MKVQFVKNAFNTGEISPFAMGRTDFQGQSGNKYDHACESLQNFIPLIQGGVTKRPGTVYVCPARNTASRLISFRFKTTKGYVLELDDFHMRFFTNGGAIVDQHTTTTADITLPVGTIPVVSTTGFASSGTILVNGQLVTYSGKTSNTFTGATGGIGVISSGSAVGHQYEITTPWAIADVGAIKFAQQNDTMYLVHPNYPPQRLVRIADTNWTLDPPNWQPPPTHEFDFDYSGGTISLSLNTGTAGATGNATTSAPFWLAGDVGRFLVVGSGIAYVVSISSSTVAVVQIIDTFATLGPYAAGTWFIRGAPSAIICVGFIDGSGNFHSTAVFGSSTQNLFSFATYPVNDVAPTFIDAFRAQDFGNYLIFSNATAFIGNVVSAHALNIQIINSVITTSIAYTNPTTGNSSIVMQAQSAGSWTIEQLSFTGANGYPKGVCFFQDRLMFAGTFAQPTTVWGSVTGDFENFAKGVQDDDALDEEINSGYREAIQWLAAYQGQIAAGTLESEYIISGGPGGLPGAGVGTAITPTNFSASIQSRYGVAPIQPLFVESHLVYIQRASQTVYEFSYDIYQGIFGSKNLNILHDIITQTGFKQVEYAAMPYRLLGFIDNSGNFLTLTYNREQDVWAWARHYTGQDLATPDAWQSVTSIPNSTGLADQFWFIVNRNINGVVTPFVEYFDPTLNIVAGDAASFATFNPATRVITGLGYLYQRIVWLNVDGAVYGPYQIDATGEITLPTGHTGTNIQVGLPACSQIVTVRPEVGQGSQTTQGKLKNWNRIWVRLYNTVGININGVEVPFRQPSDLMGQGVSSPVGTNPDVTAAEGAPPSSTFYTPPHINPNPPYIFATVDQRVENLGYDRDGRVFIAQHQPLPCTVLAMFGELNIGDR